MFASEPRMQVFRYGIDITRRRMRFLGDLMVVGPIRKIWQIWQCLKMCLEMSIPSIIAIFIHSFRETMMIHQWLSLFSPYDKAPNWLATGSESQAEQSMGRFRIYDHI
jgi:hypothetical protein